MEEDTSNFCTRDPRDGSNVLLVNNESSHSHNFAEDQKSLDKFFDTIIDAELGDSTTDQIIQNSDGLLADYKNLVSDNEIETSANGINSSVEMNEIETDISITDAQETNELLESSDPKDSNFVKPRDVLCQFPPGRIKRIVKTDPDVPVIHAESLFLISKATELFLRWLGKEVHSYTIQQKKKTIQLRDLNMAISEHPALEFLDGALD